MRVAVVLALSLLACTSAFAQNSYTAYLDEAFRETAKRHAVYIRKMVEQPDKSLKTEIRQVETNALKMTGTFKSYGTELKEAGEFTFYYPSGQVESTGMYEEGMKVGAWKRFTSGGQERPERYYDPARTEILKSVGSN